jgi:tricorn protease-like protein
MKIQSSVKIVLAATYALLVSCLDHEKSFLASDGVSTVHSMAVHKNSLFISTSNDVVQKDIGTGSIQRIFRAQKEMIQCFVITDDSRMITSSYDGTFIIWSLSTGSILRRISSGSSRI